MNLQPVRFRQLFQRGEPQVNPFAAFNKLVILVRNPRNLTDFFLRQRMPFPQLSCSCDQKLACGELWHHASVVVSKQPKHPRNDGAFVLAIRP